MRSAASAGRAMTKTESRRCGASAGMSNVTGRTGREAARRRCFWPCTVQGGGKGGYSLSRKRVSPLNPREKGQGEAPSTPDIGSLRLEELQCLPNRVRCTWLRHESLRFVTTLNRALLREARVTGERRQTACGRGIAALAALGGCTALTFCWVGTADGFVGDDVV